MEKKKRNKQITASFLGFLASASLFSALWPQKGFSETENRYLKKKPEFTAEGLLDGSFGTDYETYLSDQFPGRDAWISVKVRAELAQGKRDVNGVYFGKDDYLIEKFDAEKIEGEQLDRNLSWLAAFARKAEGVLGEGQVKIMLVPSASQVLTEKLPFLAAPYDQSRVVKKLAEQLHGGQAADKAGERILVPVEAKLKEHRKEELYYKTDHHWTTLGAYYGYLAWAESAGRVPWEAEAFQVKTVSENFLGTVHAKVNLPWEPDSIQLYLPKREPEYQVSYDDGEKGTGLYTYQALEGRDQYAVFLDGNHGLTEIVNGNAQGEAAERKLLLLKDSFAHSFAPFAVNHFGVTEMVDLRYFNGNVWEFMEEQGITDVLVLYQIPGFAKDKTVSKLAKEG